MSLRDTDRHELLDTKVYYSTQLEQIGRVTNQLEKNKVKWLSEPIEESKNTVSAAKDRSSKQFDEKSLFNSCLEENSEMECSHISWKFGDLLTGKSEGNKLGAKTTHHEDAWNRKYRHMEQC